MKYIGINMSQTIEAYDFNTKKLENHHKALLYTKIPVALYWKIKNKFLAPKK